MDLAFFDLFTTYYHLKSIIREGERGGSDDKKRAYPIYREGRDKVIEICRTHFEQMLEVAKKRLKESDRTPKYKEIILSARLLLIEALQEMLSKLDEAGLNNLESAKEMRGHVNGFVRAACRRTAVDVIGREKTGIGKASRIDVKVPPVPAMGDEQAEEIVCWIKPGGTFSKTVMAKILEKVLGTGYTLEGISISSGTRVRDKQVFEKLHPLTQRVAEQGAVLFDDDNDWEKMRQIYGKEVEDVRKMRMIPAYALITGDQERMKKNGKEEPEEGVIKLWNSKYDPNTYFKDNPEGINKLGKANTLSE